MKVTVSGGTKNQKKYSKSLAYFCAKKLMHKNLADNISVKIILRNTLHTEQNNLGTVIWEDDSYKPREFTMEIDTSVRLRRVLESVAHEMVHIKQFARGEMRDLMVAEKVSWLGASYHRHSMDYFDQPWEIEAHGRELGLFIRWAEENKLGKRRWTWDR